MSNVEKVKDETPVLRCPKGMKLPKAVKAMAALSGRNKADQNFLIRSMGIAIHEQANKSKSSSRDSNRSDRSNSLIPSSGPKA